MKILLINSNPVVSRLTALSARKEEIQIDEVQEINEVSNNRYDIVFVDADSWSKEVDSAISKNIQTQKRVLFHAQDDKKNKELFDISILKPFLPSEVSAVIRSVEEYTGKETKENFIEAKEESIFNIPETSKDKKEEPLFSLDDDINLDKKLSITADKVGKKSSLEDKEEDLFAELKDNSNDFEQQLEKAFPLKKEEELFTLDFKDDDIVEKKFDASDKEKKSTKVEKEELLDFNLDSNDLDLNLDVLSDKKSTDTETKATSTAKKEEIKKENIVEMPSKNLQKSEKRVETKILDQSEVLNIKDILENDNDSNMELDDLMTPSVQMISTSNESKKKEKKKKIKKVDEAPSIQADAVIDTLSSLPVDTLKGLLAGATIKVSIKFPKVK